MPLGLPLRLRGAELEPGFLLLAPLSEFSFLRVKQLWVLYFSFPSLIEVVTEHVLDDRVLDD